MNLPAIDRAHQQKQMNAFNLGRAETLAEREDAAYDDDQKLANTRFLAGATKVLREIHQRDPDQFYVALDELGTEGIRRGIIDPEQWDPKTVTIDQVNDMYDSAMVGLAGRPITAADPSKNVARTWYNPETQTMWAINRAGEAFDTGVDAQQFALRPVETSEGLQMVDPSRPPGQGAPQTTAVPGTDPESMRQVAVQDELATNEAGRGRVMQDGEMVPVPGSQADIEAQQRARETITGARMKSIQAQTVVEDVTRLQEQIDAGTVPFGRAADAQKLLPEVAQSRGYRNAQTLIKSVQGNVGVDQLINIKQSGAGLGQVPQAQLDLLSRLLGELDLGQEREQFMFTWNRMGRVYNQIWELADEDMRELNMPPPIIFSLKKGVTMVESPEMVWELVDQGQLSPGDLFLTPDGQLKRVPRQRTQ